MFATLKKKKEKVELSSLLQTGMERDTHGGITLKILDGCACKKHPILLNLGAFICDENPLSLYQNQRKSAPKGRHIYTYSMSVWVPPRHTHKKDKFQNMT